MPAPEPSREDLAYCRALLARGSKTFSLAGLLLPRSLRPRVATLYAFCRLSDDLIDGAVEYDGAALDTLGELRRRLARVYADRPWEHPVDRALTALVSSTGLPRVWLEALLDGYEWDVRGREYDTLEQVQDYGARVAGSVGACMGLLLGAPDQDTLARACELGVAMQLSNIARDVAEDAARGRLYLPRAWLAEAGVDTELLLLDPTPSEGLSEVLRRLLDAAEGLYQRAEHGIARLPARVRPGLRAARLLYGEIGHELARRGYDVRRRAVVPRRRKLTLLLRALFGVGAAGGELRAAPLPAVRFLLEAPRR